MKNNGPVTQREIDYPESGVFVSRTDLKGILTDANASFIEVSGFSREELFGKSHNMVRHPDMPAWAFADLWATVKSGHVWRGIVKNRAKNGDHYWVRATVSPIVTNGHVEGYLSFRKKPSRQEVSEAEALYRQYPGSDAPPKRRSLKRWFAGLTLQYKMQVIVQPVLFVLLTGSTAITYYQIRSNIFDDAASKAEAVAMQVIDGANMLMVTGSIGDKDNRRLLIKKIIEGQHLESLRLVRTEQVVKQYGEGLPEEKLNDPLVKSTIEESVRAGKSLPNISYDTVDGKNILRVITPYIESHNFHGTDCLLCHQIEVGSSNGATDLTVDLSPEFKRLKIIVITLAAGQLLLQILFYFIFGWVSRRFVARPLVEVAAHLDEIVAGDFSRMANIDGRDEVGELLGKVQSTKILMGATIDRIVSIQQYQSLFEQMPEGVILFGTDLRVLTFNHEALLILEYSPEEMKQLHVWDIEVIVDRNTFEQRKQNIQTMGRDDFESKYRTRGGNVVDVDVSVKIMSLPDGETAFQVLFHDITEHNLMKKQLHQNIFRTNAIAKLSEAVSLADSEDQLYEAALDTLQQTLGCDRASILLFDPDGVIRFKAVRNISDAYIRRFTGHSPWKPDEMNAKPILVPDEEEWEDGKTLVSEFRREGIRALAFIPLTYQNRLLGKFMVYFNLPHFFSEDEIQLAQTIAYHIGYGIAELQAESALRNSEKRWRFALEGGGDIVWDWNLETNQVVLSEDSHKIFGFSGHEIGTNMLEWRAKVHPEDGAVLDDELRRLFREHSEKVSVTYRFLCKDGTWKWIHTRGMVVQRNEVGRVTQMIGTHADITEQKNAVQQIEYLAYHDQLTGLANRRLLQDRMMQAISSAVRRSGLIAVLFVDLDHFKDVNDTLGHHVGDQLLQIVSKRLLSVIRSEDTLARVGGDEFVIMLNNVTSEEEVATVAEKIIRELVQPVQFENDEFRITPSIGISLCPQDGHNADDLMRHADAALYLAKEAGRATYRFYTRELQEKIQERLKIEKLLRNASKHNEFEVYYQPKVNLRTGHIIGCEALIRWNHGMGQVSPAVFIPVAEQSDLIVHIGDWVIHEACQQAKSWHDQGWPLNVSFNVSARQFMNPDKFMGSLRTALHDSRVNPEQMEIELTEGLLIDFNGMGKLLKEVSALGVRLALDDFGTGYSSLSYLRRFPINVLKIDQSFVNNTGQGKEDIEMVKTIIGMAHNLSMIVVAEGVETEEQHGLLVTQGCEIGQGYYYSRPMPVAAFEVFLREWCSGGAIKQTTDLSHRILSSSLA